MDIWNQILTAISLAIRGIYPEIAIFAEEVPENLPESCFLIGFAGDREIERELAGNVRISGTLDLAYYTNQQSLTLRSTLNQVGARLAFQLESAAFGGVTVRLNRHQCRVEDDVLHDLCAFSVLLRRTENAALIQTIALTLERRNP